METNRRQFLTGIGLGLFSILPGAGRVWKATREVEPMFVPLAPPVPGIYELFTLMYEMKRKRMEAGIPDISPVLTGLSREDLATVHALSGGVYTEPLLVPGPHPSLVDECMKYQEYLRIKFTT